jgi:tRNA nucleotidyltransferase (CCA-adding enzyme)
MPRRPPSPTPRTGAALDPLVERLMPDGTGKLLRLLGRLAAGRGVGLYLVGGSVRDLLLERPAVDLDLAVLGPADRLAADLVARRGGKFRSHDRFGTVIVELADGSRVDLAAARSERYREPAALPEVAAGTLDEDLARRDFSVNALAARVTGRGLRGIVDPCGGLADLAARRIRVLHDASFVDDPTRAFRAVRFAARLGFAIERRTATHLDRAIDNGLVNRLSPIRLRRELNYLLAEPRVPRAVDLLERHGLLRTIDRQLRRTAETPALLRRGRSVALRLARLRPEHAVDLPTLMLALLQRGLPAAARRRMLARLNPGRNERAILEQAPVVVGRVLSSLGRLRAVEPGKVARLCDRYPLPLLVVALTLAPTGPVRTALSGYVERWQAVRPDLTGRELLAAGVPQGPGVAAGLRAARLGKLDGTARGGEAQLRLALRAARRARRTTA